MWEGKQRYEVKWVKLWSNKINSTQMGYKIDDKLVEILFILHNNTLT